MIRNYSLIMILLQSFTELAINGCSDVDKFSERAIQYNLKAERAQQQALFLNVIRAYLRRPMQFTTLQTVTGTASSSSGVQLTLPFGHQSGPNPDTFQLTETLSGGPTFTVPILDTQEFYQGILSPVSDQLLDFYIQGGYPRELLYDLFVDRITMKPVGENSSHQEISLRNYVGRDSEFDPFQEMIDILINMGLTTEKAAAATPYGPPLRASVFTARDLAAAATAGLDLKKVRDGAVQEYQFEKSGGKLRFCFRSAQGGLVDQALLCGRAGKADTGQIGQFLIHEDNGIMGLAFAEALESRALPELNQVLGMYPGLRNQKFSIEFYMRSTESIIYYLGTIVRRQIDPEYHESRRIMKVKFGPSAERFPLQQCPVI